MLNMYPLHDSTISLLGVFQEVKTCVHNEDFHSSFCNKYPSIGKRINKLNMSKQWNDTIVQQKIMNIDESQSNYVEWGKLNNMEYITP